MDNNIPEVNLDHLRPLAYRAHSNTSFDPEKRANTVIMQYSQELRNDLQEIKDKGLSNVSSAELEQTLTSYRQKYEKHLSAWLHSHSNVASSMITGPANFPIARMEKYRKWADNKYEHFRAWRQRALKAIFRNVRPKVNELEQIRQYLKQREETREQMAAANKVVRKGGSEVFDNLRQLGLSEGLVRQIYATGFRPYQLQNVGAEIRRLRTRVAKLEAKENLAQTKGEKTEEIDGVKLVHNYQADRVQLLFDVKPDQETLIQLKSHGFRWTPSQRAWQRKLTNQAINDAQSIIKGIERS